MSTSEVVEMIRDSTDRHVGDERELLSALLTLAAGWKMRVEEIDANVV